MPSGFNLKGVQKDKDGSDKNMIDNEFLVQQIGRTNEMLEQLTKLQAAQMQIQQQMVQTQKSEPEPDPVKPPEEFDITQIHNPETESGKFFQSLLEQRDNKLKGDLLEEFKKTLQEQRFEQELDRKFNTIKEKFEVDDENLKGFREWVQKPDGADLDVLFEVYSKINSKDDKDGIGTPSGMARHSGGGNEPDDDNEGGFLSGLK